MSKNLPPDKIPLMAKGSVIPFNILKEQLNEEKEKERIRKQRIHDYLIATYGIIGGLFSGAIGSIIVLKLQGLL